MECNAADYFYPPNSKAHSPEYWPRFLISETACRRSNHNLSVSDREILGLLTSDMILLREFRYRSTGTGHRKAIFWMRRENTVGFNRQTSWQSRPWRLSNFPPQPRSLAAEPLSHGRSYDMVDFDIYQSRCTRLRRILKVCPAALSSPALWQKCFSTILESNAQEMDLTRNRSFSESHKTTLNLFCAEM